MSECVPWSGTIRPDGYGQLYVQGKLQIAHRVAWFLEYGSYPDYPREVIDHLCRNRACVNVEHLRITTIGGNVLAGETIPARNKAKTHCPKNHEYTPENTYVSKNGWRQCRQCFTERRYAQKVGV